jgi:hypothetical protein
VSDAVDGRCSVIVARFCQALAAAVALDVDLVSESSRWTLSRNMSISRRSTSTSCNLE